MTALKCAFFAVVSFFALDAAYLLATTRQVRGEVAVWEGATSIRPDGTGRPFRTATLGYQAGGRWHCLPLPIGEGDTGSRVVVVCHPPDDPAMGQIYGPLGPTTVLALCVLLLLAWAAAVAAPLAVGSLPTNPPENSRR